MINRRTLLAGVATCFAAPTLLRAETEPYVLGTLFPMTGLLAELGGVYTNAVALALEHIAADGRLKRPIVLRTQDSQSTPQGGAVGMSKLVNVDRAICVLTGITGVIKAAEPIGTRAKVMMLNGGGVGPDLAGLSPYLWNVIPLANQELPTALEWMKAAGKKRVALIYLDDPLGNAMLKGLRELLPGIGGALVGEFSAAPSAQQFSAIVAKVRETNPDVVYVASYGTQQTQIFKQLRDNGITQQIITYSVGGTPSVATLPEADGLLFTSQAADWSKPDRMTQRFVEGWRGKHKNDPTTYAQNYYNGALLFSEMIARLESAGATIDGERLRDSIQNGEYDLVGGKARFANNGVVGMPMQLNQVMNRKFQKVG